MSMGVARRSGRGQAGTADCYMRDVLENCQTGHPGRWCPGCTGAYLDQADRGGLTGRQRVPDAMLDPGALARRRPDLDTPRPVLPRRTPQAPHTRRGRRWDGVAIKIDRATVTLQGGPRDGWCYYADDWQRMVAAAAGYGKPLPYRYGGGTVTHPGSWPPARAVLWRYDPDLDH